VNHICYRLDACFFTKQTEPKEQFSILVALWLSWMTLSLTLQLCLHESQRDCIQVSVHTPVTRVAARLLIRAAYASTLLHIMVKNHSSAPSVTSGSCSRRNCESINDYTQVNWTCMYLNCSYKLSLLVINGVMVVHCHIGVILMTSTAAQQVFASWVHTLCLWYSRYCSYICTARVIC